MIGKITGILEIKTPSFLLIEVSGIGYEIQIPASTFCYLPDAGEKVTLFTHLQIKEDAHVLFGFFEEQERVFFKELIKISGVGPKMALAILSGIPIPVFIQCIERKDPSFLIRLPGVGKKTAERLILEMANKVGCLSQAIKKPDDVKFLPHPIEHKDDTTSQNEAISALISLGYKPQEASMAVYRANESQNTLTSQDLIRRSLQSLAKG